MTTERLSGLDASFLYMESPTLPLHVALTLVFDPSTVPGGYSFRRLRQVIAGRLPEMPVFQRRLVEVPLRLGQPLWVDDPDFDIDNHLHRAALPAPAGMRELAEFASEQVARPLDRSRPLWDMWVIEGMEGGRLGVVAKMHHSTVDGVSGAELMSILLDVQPEPRAPTAAPVTHGGDHVPSPPELVSQALLSRMLVPLGIPRMLWRTSQSLLDIRRIRQRPGGRAALPLTAPRTSLNGAVCSRRRLAFTAASLDDVKRVKNAVGCTVNDVILALCTGALRSYLLAGDELPEQPLVAVLPVSVKPDTAALRGTNKVSAMFVQLPTHLADPLERLDHIQADTRGAKEEHQALGADTLQQWAEQGTPNLFGLASRVYTGMRLADHHRPVANLVLSNFPGPDFPLYLGGAEMLAAFPMGPVIDGMGLNMTVMSYRGVLYFGLAACARRVPRVWDIASAVPRAFEELMATLGLQPQPFDIPLHLGPGMPAEGRPPGAEAPAP